LPGAQTLSGCVEWSKLIRSIDTPARRIGKARQPLISGAAEP
jgi:hypothetical protein